jgi:glucosamine--fructose-6-phosphate aminotransferase (isomerizing)
MDINYFWIYAFFFLDKYLKPLNLFMCGIVAILGDGQTSDDLTKAVNGVLNRGYDSVGFLGFGKTQSPVLIKKVDRAFETWSKCMSENKDLISKCQVSLCHTRWATHGYPTVKNAHPHCDINRRFFMVHNGIIENFEILKSKLPQAYFPLESKTDTEVLINYISWGFSLSSKTFEHYLQHVFRTEEIQGTWAVVIADVSDPDSLFIARKQSSLLIGVNSSKITIGSEQRIFGALDRVFSVPDGFIGRLSLSNIESVCERLEKLSSIDETMSLKPVTFWTEQEILEQPQVIDKALMQATIPVEKLFTFNHLILIACGSSRNAALFAAPFFRKSRRFMSVQVIEASEFQNEHVSDQGSSVFIFISQSGETLDCYKVFEKVSDHYCMGIINVKQSLLARSVNAVLYTHAGLEVGVAATKSFTSQVVVLLAVAALCDLNSYCYLSGLSASFDVNMRSLQKSAEHLANELYVVPSLILLGRETCHAIVQEAALKIKEISYIHAEAFAAGTLKHGPFALLDSQMPVFLNMMSSASDLSSTCQELHARRARVIVVTNIRTVALNPPDFIDDVVFIQEANPMFASFVSVVFYQWLAYYLALAKNINPDQPRNLAKTVTV